MSKKVFIAEQETLLEVQEQVEKLVRNLVPDDAPIYGMVIHEASDLNPSTRVEYLGANKDFTPMSMNMSTHAMNYGSWAGWDWLKANVPVMCNWDGGIDYFLDPDDYTKKRMERTLMRLILIMPVMRWQSSRKSTRRNIRLEMTAMYISVKEKWMMISMR